jgi:uridylate kinase
MRYKRILLKASGELVWREPQRIAEEIKELMEEGIRCAIVTGGGNIIRGVNAQLLPRETADQIGMIGTSINAILLESFLRKTGLKSSMYSPIPVGGIIKPYSPQEALSDLEEGKVVLLAGGTGNPYFSTDTAAAIRGVELRCEVLLKGTKVNGVYEADPKEFPQAKRFERLSYEEFLKGHFKVMDETAVFLCKEFRLPIIVFDLSEPGGLKKALTQGIGTLIS